MQVPDAYTTAEFQGLKSMAEIQESNVQLFDVHSKQFSFVSQASNRMRMSIAHLHKQQK
jgi:hypothetical protein